MSSGHSVITQISYNKKVPHFSEGLSKKRQRIESEGRHAAPIKKITLTDWSGLLKKGSDILSHITAVPSAQSGLTSLFGMGRGEPRRNNHLKAFCKGN